MNGPRNMWTGFGRSVNTYFVPLQEKVGAENVDRRWPSGSASTFRSSNDAEITAEREQAAPVRAVHPRRHRHRAAGAGQRVRDRGRRRQVLRADPGQSRSSTSRATSCDVGRPAVQAGRRARRSPAPPSTRPAARSATRRPAASAPAAPPARTAGGRAASRRPPGRRQDRHHRQQLDRQRWSSTHQAARGRRHLADPDFAQTSHTTARRAAGQQGGRRTPCATP